MDAHHPPQPPSAATIEAGQQALERGAWEEARSAFERVLSTNDEGAPERSPPEGSAEIVSGLAEALWWLGEIRESLECWERAYLGFRTRSDPAQAASVAIQLGVLYDANFGNHAAAGWVARAARLVDEHALEPLRGWVLMARATGAADSGQHEALARQAHQLTRTSVDRHLELCANSDRRCPDRSGQDHRRHDLPRRGDGWRARGCYEPVSRMPAACWRKRQVNATK
jgi:tetratricopeptide (TPR) repeat protein